ncbi:MAG: DivIVA domain-containing protein [Actinomycetota bacterium]
MQVEDQTSLDPLTPDEVESASFPEQEYGYEKMRVDAFLHAVAERLRALLRELDIAEVKVEQPLLGVGREIGSLLHESHEAAEELLTTARMEAATLLQDADRMLAQAKKEVERTEREASRRAEALVSDAQAEVDRLRSEASRAKHNATAESVVIRREAERHAKEIRAEAQREGRNVIADATGRAEATARELETRIRRLQEAEEVLRARVQGASDRNKKPEVRPRAAEKSIDLRTGHEG